MVSGILAARLLGVDGRGYLALIILFPYVLAQVIGMGVPLSVTYETARNRQVAPNLVWHLAPLAAFQCVAVVVVHVALLLTIFDDAPASVRAAGWLSLVVPPTLIVEYYYLAVLQGQGSFRPFNVLRAAPFVFYGGGIALLALLGADSVAAFTAVWASTYVAATAWTILLATRRLRKITPSKSVPSRGRMISFGLRGVIGWASPSENFKVDQMVVGLLLSPAALGIYVVGQAFANLPRLIGQSIGIVAYERVAREHSRFEGWGTMWRYAAVGTLLSAAVVVVLEISASVLVPLLFGAEFDAGISIMRILLLSALFTSSRRVLTDGARGAGHPGIGTVAEVGGWVLMLGGFIALVPALGTHGVAWALCLSAVGSLGFLVFALLAAQRREIQRNVPENESSPRLPVTVPVDDGVQLRP